MTRLLNRHTGSPAHGPCGGYGALPPTRSAQVDYAGPHIYPAQERRGMSKAKSDGAIRREHVPGR